MKTRPRLFLRTCQLTAFAGTVGLFSSVARAQTGPFSFYPLRPCRLWDTRTTHPPKMNANEARDFTVRGLCTVPSAAQAVSINLTAVQATDSGNLRAYAAGSPNPPLASVLNFLGDGVAIANGALLPLGDNGSGGHLTIKVEMSPGSVGQVHTLADVTGYFQ